MLFLISSNKGSSMPEFRLPVPTGRKRTLVLAAPLVLATIVVVGCRGEPKDRAATQSAMTATSRATGPAKLVLERGFVDMGTMAPGSERDVSVGVRNGGGERLIIRKVETGCNCVLAAVEPEAIDPGGSATLSLKVRTLKHPGVYRADIAIASNDPGGVRRLTLCFDVPDALAAEPGQLCFGVVRPGQQLTRKLKVVANRSAVSSSSILSSTLRPQTDEGRPQTEGRSNRSAVSSRSNRDVTSKVLYAIADSGSLVGRVIQPEVRPGAAAELEVAMTAPARPGTYRYALNVNTASKDAPAVRVPVVVSVSDAATVELDAVDFGRMARGSQPARELRVTVRPGTRLESVSARPAVLDVDTPSGPLDGGGSIVLRPNGGIPFGPVRGELALSLAGNETSVLTIPFRAYVTEGADPEQPAAPGP